MQLCNDSEFIIIIIIIIIIKCLEDEITKPVSKISRSGDSGDRSKSKGIVSISLSVSLSARNNKEISPMERDPNLSCTAVLTK